MKLVVFGESLGLFGGEVLFMNFNNIFVCIDGVLFSGLMFNNIVWNFLIVNCDVGLL